MAQQNNTIVCPNIQFINELAVALDPLEAQNVTAQNVVDAKRFKKIVKTCFTLQIANAQDYVNAIHYARKVELANSNDPTQSAILNAINQLNIRMNNMEERLGELINLLEEQQRTTTQQYKKNLIAITGDQPIYFFPPLDAEFPLPANLPQTRSALFQMNGATCTAIENSYALISSNEINERRRNIAHFIGLILEI